MAMFRAELRGARPINGHTGEAPITTTTDVEASSWFEAREKIARRFGIDPMDPLLLVTLAEPVLEIALPEAELPAALDEGEKVDSWLVG